MEKTITANVPNELWVADFSANKTANFNYNGPQNLWIIVEQDNSVVDYSETEPALSENKTAVVVDMATSSLDKQQAATLLVMRDTEYEYTYTPETNHDGSIYQRITNPRLSDYYTLRYNPSQGFELKIIEKDKTIVTEEIAKERKAYVEKYYNTYSFSSEIEAQILQYLSDITNYLQSVETAYPWKYVQINKNEVPKIPVNLVQVFNTLPALS